MIFKSVKEHKGFFLKNGFELSKKVTVLTGKNGSGKTRFLEAVQEAIQVFDGDRLIGPHNIKLVLSSEMQGVFHNGYNREDQSNRLNAIVALYKRDREKFAAPCGLDHGFGYHDGVVDLGFEQLHKCFSSIGNKLGKSVWNLEDDEIRLYFARPLQIWGALDIGGLCNEYMRRKRENYFSMWLSEKYGYKRFYIQDADFEKEFGAPPWLLFNEVLNEIFDGKIAIDLPFDQLSDEIYVPVLREVDSQQILPLDGLSSGERNLLWLAVTLFKLKYKGESTFGVPELILLDEPDAFLHPKMVVKFYSLIQLISESFGCSFIFTTHSPTTVALAPDQSVYKVTPTEIISTEKDEAIADLLDGVSQISLSSRNRREVFVESKSDGELYRYIFDKIKSKFPTVDPKISLTFLAAGPKMPIEQIESKAKQFFGVIGGGDLQRFAEELNGVGGCGQVTAMVESLSRAGNSTVRGVVDWDLKNKHKPNIVVSGFGVFYTIENILLNPIYLLRLLYSLSPDKYPLSRYCGREVALRAWTDDVALLQISIDNFIQEFNGGENAKNVEVEFLGGHTLLLDKKYLQINGHDLMGQVLDKYPKLNEVKNRNGGVLSALVRIMVDDFGWEHVPRCFDELFSALQR